ncbi:hypothetical protein BU641_02205 [Staphylococcus chromogenes]|nr:hypothetical protein BU641_02205 [Staphylococcus chromogenes]
MIRLLHENYLTQRHGKAAGCVSNLSLHRIKSPTLDILHEKVDSFNLFSVKYLCLIHIPHYFTLNTPLHQHFFVNFFNIFNIQTFYIKYEFFITFQNSLYFRL